MCKQCRDMYSLSSFLKFFQKFFQKLIFLKIQFTYFPRIYFCYKFTHIKFLENHFSSPSNFFFAFLCLCLIDFELFPSYAKLDAEESKILLAKKCKLFLLGILLSICIMFLILARIEKFVRLVLVPNVKKKK